MTDRIERWESVQSGRHQHWCEHDVFMGKSGYCNRCDNLKEKTMEEKKEVKWWKNKIGAYERALLPFNRSDLFEVIDAYHAQKAATEEWERLYNGKEEVYELMKAKLERANRIIESQDYTIAGMVKDIDELQAKQAADESGEGWETVTAYAPTSKIDECYKLLQNRYDYEFRIQQRRPNPTAKKEEVPVESNETIAKRIGDKWLDRSYWVSINILLDYLDQKIAKAVKR